MYSTTILAKTAIAGAAGIEIGRVIGVSLLGSCYFGLNLQAEGAVYRPGRKDFHNIILKARRSSGLPSVR